MSVSANLLNRSLIECSYFFPVVVMNELKNVQATYRNLSVGFDYYHCENGAKSKLVNLNGTIPVLCRGIIYNVPISIWLHNEHPQIPPKCFVKKLPILHQNPGIHIDNTGLVSSSYLHNWRYPASHLVGLIEDMRKSFQHCLIDPLQVPLSQEQHSPTSLVLPPWPSTVPSIGNNYSSFKNIPQPLNSGCFQPFYSNIWSLGYQYQGSAYPVTPVGISPSSSSSRPLHETVERKSDQPLKKKMDSVEQTADLFEDLHLDKVLNAFDLATSLKNKQVAERVVKQEHRLITINNKKFPIQVKLYDEKDGMLGKDVIGTEICPMVTVESSSIPVDLPKEKSEIFQSLMSIQDNNFTAEDVMEAVQSGLNFESALRYLSHECPICGEHVTFSKVVTMTYCNCSFCKDCFRQYFSSVIKEKSIVNMVCPKCSAPDLKSPNLQEDVTEYFNFLDIQIRYYLDEGLHELFQRKLRDRTLMEMPNFRWCAHCSFGLLHEVDRLRMDCPSCKKSTCFQCKIPWEQQHEGISCEKFKLWKQQNNPEYQASKLDVYLTKNGIECPNCRVRFDLSRGGCIHFRCTECHYQFCGGCKQPFKLGSACGFMSDCHTKGLHAHHPRDCFYHLRDWSVERLQQLLNSASISLTGIVTDNSLKQMEGKCKVTEQRDTSQGLKDEQCGHPSVKGYLGFCKMHFVEFLVELINKNSLDPVLLYNKEEMLIELQRWGVAIPIQHVNEEDKQFTQRLRVKILNELKLDNPQKVFDKNTG
ncbi:E3 ubiquitin-protein ligase RNF31 isoform X4 [Hemiscyllium ocellatum]|uniref:E3 ubiquitin-protein ligase RNF31 isoform X4 n=1 Tax=Hemiscyllium ocellatum TaxID=170820 RepID=UPI0029661EC7|nr:E3 ubiquitin-protein ligase RNF31 isoform X4 [Hemiscyllium ocellatum]